MIIVREEMVGLKYVKMTIGDANDQNDIIKEEEKKLPAFWDTWEQTLCLVGCDTAMRYFFPIDSIWICYHHHHHHLNQLDPAKASDAQGCDHLQIIKSDVHVPEWEWSLISCWWEDCMATTS